MGMECWALAKQVRFAGTFCFLKVQLASKQCEVQRDPSRERSITTANKAYKQCLSTFPVLQLAYCVKHTALNCIADSAENFHEMQTLSKVSIQCR